MHIHSFRVGKTYIEFEKYFFPRIYLLCGINGSGKSHFLKLLFASLNMNINYASMEDIELVIGRGSGKEILYFTNGRHLISLCFTNGGNIVNEIKFSKDPLFIENKQVFLMMEESECYGIGPLHLTPNVLTYSDSTLTKKFGLGRMSRGERKREMLRNVLLGTKEESIFLMDDLDSGFHPDSQYQIIRDLQDWGPQHQYIITTHSYDMCETLTPANVKEII